MILHMLIIDRNCLISFAREFDEFFMIDPLLSNVLGDRQEKLSAK